MWPLLLVKPYAIVMNLVFRGEVLDHCNGVYTGEFFIVCHQLEDSKTDMQMCKLEEIESLMDHMISNNESNGTLRRSEAD